MTPRKPFHSSSNASPSQPLVKVTASQASVQTASTEASTPALEQHIRPFEHTREIMSINVEEAHESHGKRSAMHREFGAHLRQQDGVLGTHFAVWAPSAREVSVIGDRNGWHHGQHTLHPSEAGVWRGFVPHVQAGDKYKYSIRTHDNQIIEKADPYAFACEARPHTASIVTDLNTYSWNDNDWLEHRASTDWFAEPISIYEVHLASWRRPKDAGPAVTKLLLW